MNDHEIVLRIQELLDGVEWTPATLDEIAQVLSDNGYTIRDLDGEKLPTSDETPENKDKFSLFYECPRCQEYFSDSGPHVTNDDCPYCGQKDVAPYEVQDNAEQE